MNKAELVKAVKELTLPPDEYVVVGSGILTMLGIRDSKDIDLVLTPNIFQSFKDEGWSYSTVDIEGRLREKLEHDPFEAFRDFWCGGVTYDTREMIKNAEVIEGVRFMPLELLIRLKQSMGRDKDLKDIELIGEYRATH